MMLVLALMPSTQKDAHEMVVIVVEFIPVVVAFNIGATKSILVL